LPLDGSECFPKKEVEAEMNKFVLVKLFTDGEGEIYERQQQFQEKLLPNRRAAVLRRRRAERQNRFDFSRIDEKQRNLLTFCEKRRKISQEKTRKNPKIKKNQNLKIYFLFVSFRVCSWLKIFMKTVKIENLIEGLREIPDTNFQCDNVYQFLAENPVDVDSIAPFFHWSDKFYTRNLIYKDARFELMDFVLEQRAGFARSQSRRPDVLDDVPIGVCADRIFAPSRWTKKNDFVVSKKPIVSIFPIVWRRKSNSKNRFIKS
jgi:hypothetical protein